MDLNLRQVRAFVSVVQAGSFTRAAALLNLSQPALTVQIRRLEETLDARLLDRTSRTVAPTRLGRDLLPVFQRVLRDLDAGTRAEDKALADELLSGAATLARPVLLANLRRAVLDKCAVDSPKYAALAAARAEWGADKE